MTAEQNIELHCDGEGCDDIWYGTNSTIRQTRAWAKARDWSRRYNPARDLCDSCTDRELAQARKQS